MTQVNLVDLSLTYEGQEDPAISDLSLEIEAGKLTALLGPSGCGKSTTMKIVAGVLRPTKGEVQFDGRSVLNVPAERRGAVMVFQKHLLFPYMSIAENVGFGLKMRGVPRSEQMPRIRRLLELVRLSGYEDRRPAELSGGQQQRVALARALIIEPRVLLLDEPLSALDAHLRDEMRELIATLQRQLEITTILVTHDQEEAVVLADRIALMFRGQICQYDTPERFYARPKSVEIAHFFGARNFLRATVRTGFADTALGELKTDSGLVSDGPAVLTIRPEAVVLGESGGNSRLGQVVSRVYLGTQVRYRIAIGDVEIDALAGTSARWHLREGDEVPVSLPADSLWAMPDSDDAFASKELLQGSH